MYTVEVPMHARDCFALFCQLTKSNPSLWLHPNKTNKMNLQIQKTTYDLSGMVSDKEEVTYHKRKRPASDMPSL
jgi:hypothetical protein